MHSYVYFIHSPATGRIKIGRSVSVHDRLRKLQTGSADRLVLLGYVNGGAELERKIHSALAEHRQVGEWFSDQIRPTVDLLLTDLPTTVQSAIPSSHVDMKHRNALVAAWNRAGPTGRKMFLEAIGAVIA